MAGEKFLDSTLGAKLRELRKSKGVKSAQALSELMGHKYDYSTISRRESGDQKIDFEYLQDFCQVLGLSQEERESVMTSARLKLSRIKERKEDLAEEYAKITLNLKLFRGYSSGYIDCYLQTYDYAREIMVNYGFYKNPNETARLRIESYKRSVSDLSKKFRIICSENSLYFPVGNPSVMLTQLNSLLLFRDEPHIEFRLLPNDVFVSLPLHETFNLIDNNYCFCENRLDFSITDDPATVGRFQAGFNTMWEHSVMGARRSTLIKKAIAYYKGLK